MIFYVHLQLSNELHYPEITSVSTYSPPLLELQRLLPISQLLHPHMLFI
jgi:hypothetical protein